MRKLILFGCVAMALLFGVAVVMAADGSLSSVPEPNRESTESDIITSVIPAEKTAITREDAALVCINGEDGKSQYVWVPVGQAEAFIEDQIAQKIERRKAEGTYVESEPVYHTLYNRCYAVATAEQRAEMDSYRGPFYGGIEGYPRQMRIIVGDLPANAPRLTLEQAERIILEQLRDPNNSYSSYYDRIKTALREVAEMDYDGGSGFAYTHFCLNDSMTRYIEVSSFGVRYYDTEADLCIDMCFFTEPETFTSASALIGRDEVPEF